MKINITLCIIVIVLSLLRIPLRGWIYDGSYTEEFSENCKILLIILDVAQDIVVIYFLLNYLLYSFN